MNSQTITAGGAEQRVAPRGVGYQQQQRQFENDPVPNQAIAAAAECGQGGMAAQEHIDHLHRDDRRQASRGGRR
jgi:hypothetical protein